MAWGKAGPESQIDSSGAWAVMVVKGGLKDASVAVRVVSAYALAAVCSAAAESAAGASEAESSQLPLTSHVPLSVMWELLEGEKFGRHSLRFGQARFGLSWSMCPFEQSTLPFPVLNLLGPIEAIAFLGTEFGLCIICGARLTD